MSDQAPKICPHCNRPLAEDGRSCPQGPAPPSKARWLLLLGIFWSLLWYGFMAVVAIYFFRFFFFRSADFTAYKDKVKVSEAWLHRDETERNGQVTILGHIRNDSTMKWEHPYFEVQCFNHAGKLVDTYATYDMGLVLLPETEHAFRLTFAPSSPPVHWADFKVYLRDARDARGWLR